MKNAIWRVLGLVCLGGGGMLFGLMLPTLYASFLYWCFHASPFERSRRAPWIGQPQDVQVVSFWGEQLKYASEGQRYLIRGLGDPEPSVRIASATLLGFSGDRGVMDALSTAASDSDSRVRVAAAGALGRRIGRRAIPALRHLLEDENESVRRRAATTLSNVVSCSHGTGVTSLHSTIER
jgi:hypothetical protein